jgi:tellurite resistance protein TerC
MLAEHYVNMVINKNMQVVVSLLFIVLCIGGSIVYSIYHKKKGAPIDIVDDPAS